MLVQNISKKTIVGSENLYVDYCQHRKPTIKSLSAPKNRKFNPLYSADSFHKYFDCNGNLKPKQLTEQFVTKKQKINNKSKHIEEFKKLQQSVTKFKKDYPFKPIVKKINTLNKFVETAKQHFLSLDIDEGKSPRNSFSRKNFVIQSYIQQLKQPIKYCPTSKRYLYAQNMRRRVHTENIVQYLSKEFLQSRYYKLPKFQRQNEQRLDMKSLQRKNKQLRSKTEYCRKQYTAPYLKSSRVDDDMLRETRIYMSQRSKY